MTDQLEERLRAHIGRKIELLAEQLNPDWHRSGSHALAVMNCADAASAPVAREVARLRERERRLVGALEAMAEEHEHQALAWRYEAQDEDNANYHAKWGRRARAALADTAAPAAQQEGE